MFSNALVDVNDMLDLVLYGRTAAFYYVTLGLFAMGGVMVGLLIVTKSIKFFLQSLRGN